MLNSPTNSPTLRQRLLASVLASGVVLTGATIMCNATKPKSPAPIALHKSESRQAAIDFAKQILELYPNSQVRFLAHNAEKNTVLVIEDTKNKFFGFIQGPYINHLINNPTSPKIQLRKSIDKETNLVSYSNTDEEQTPNIIINHLVGPNLQRSSPKVSVFQSQVFAKNGPIKGLEIQNLQEINPEEINKNN